MLAFRARFSFRDHYVTLVLIRINTVVTMKNISFHSHMVFLKCWWSHWIPQKQLNFIPNMSFIQTQWAMGQSVCGVAVCQEPTVFFFLSVRPKLKITQNIKIQEVFPRILVQSQSHCFYWDIMSYVWDVQHVRTCLCKPEWAGEPAGREFFFYFIYFFVASLDCVWWNKERSTKQQEMKHLDTWF